MEPEVLYGAYSLSGNQSVSTEAAACPHCGAPQQRLAPPLLPPQEETIYSDSVVTVTNARVTIGGTTYALRNVTSVRLAYSPPEIVWAVFFLVIGGIILLAAFTLFNDNEFPIGVYIIAGVLIVGAILRMITAKTYFYVGLSTTSGELHLLSSKDKSYIQCIVQSINEAIVKYR